MVALPAAAQTTPLAAPMSTVRYATPATTAADGRVFVFGGFDGSNTLNSVEAYSPNTGSWASVAPMPTARYLSAAATGPDGRLYVIGGYVAGQILRTVEAYSPSSNTWATVAPMPTARYLLAAATGSDGRIYAIGGFNRGRWLTTVQAYNVATNTWATVAPMPSARGALGAAEGSDGLIYAAGGSNVSVENMVNTVEAYSPVTNVWTTKPSLPGRRKGFGLVTGSDGNLYAIGGVGAPNASYISEVLSLTPGATAWTKRPSLPEARYLLAAAAGSGADASLYAIGGYNFTTSFATMAVFNLATHTWSTSSQPPGSGSVQSAKPRTNANDVNTAPALVAAANDWSTFRHDREHTGLSPETGLGAALAGNLHLAWSANLGTSSYSSAAVVFNSVLGKRVAYIGNSNGLMTAFDADSGTVIWNTQIGPVGNAIQTGMAVDGDVLYFGSKTHSMYALQASTGNVICSLATTGVISAAPVVGRPDATGAVVYFGDSGPSGVTADGGHEWAMNGVGNTAGNCTLKWSYNQFGNPAGAEPGTGTYSAPALGHNSSGRELVVFGSTEPDMSVYALDAVTGSRVWRFQGQLGPDEDIGASPTISEPGTNGIADGVVYVESKIAIAYAIDLTTGSQLWSFNFKANGAKAPSQSGAALVGSHVYLGEGNGMFALDAVTGAVVWQTVGLAGFISSPSIAGATNDQIIFAGDLAGNIDALNLATGAVVWQYATGGFIYSSPAISNGHVYIASADGFLYSFSE